MEGFNMETESANALFRCEFEYFENLPGIWHFSVWVNGCRVDQTGGFPNLESAKDFVKKNYILA
jgi:hypothetical protein